MKKYFLCHEEDYERFGVKLDFEKLKKAKTISEFKSHVIFPLYNYKNFQEYYKKANSN